MLLLALALFLTLIGPPDSAVRPPDSKPGTHRPPHHLTKGFRNPWSDEREYGFRDFFRWRQYRKEVEHSSSFRDAAALPIVEPNWLVIHEPGDSLVVTWIGHATCLVQIGGLSILTDPIFSDRCSPVSFAGPQRVTPLPLDPARLPAIDYVLISHNHYDHLDRATVRLLGNHPTWFVPLGLKAWFARQGITNTVEMDWWDSTELRNGGEVVCVPARHFSSRTPWNRNEVLWAGWVLSSGKQRFYYAGDTGYSVHFAEIGAKVGPIDLALLPIGAYKPEWFMLPMHISPQQAVQAHLDLGVERSVGIHWGTFILADEPFEEPPRLFRASAVEAGLSEDQIIVLQHGQTLVLP
ncbi:MAG: MBL fold metallo-hydrolase [Fidelibacterota bacterium]|nr:MAG: MBL fold metallo-hydrolase [Candidatus Neomarinimicrobiota bacterium]